MGIKQVLDRNPIVTLVVTCVSVGSVIAAVMAYFANERISAMEEREKAQIAELSAKSTAELTSVSNSLKATIADLSFRLTSIQRTIPGTEPTYVDISKIIIGNDAVKSLAPQYKSVWGGEFYLNQPQIEGWSVSDTNELELIRLIYGDKTADIIPDSLRKVLSDAKILMWKGKTHASIDRLTTYGQNITLTYYPMVYIQRFGKHDISKRNNVVINILDDDEARSKTAQSMEKLNNELKNQDNKDQENKVANVSDNSLSGETMPGKDTPEEIRERSERKIKIIDDLNSVYSADMASFVMTDTIMTKMMQANIFGHDKYRVFSAQKKGNVLYLQGQESFETPESASQAGGNSRIDVNEETLYFSLGENGFLVRIFLPEIEGRSEDAAWIRNWLAGLQIPLNQ